jgi:hypothetical protein
MLYLDCPNCGERRQVETPPCAERHRAGCPDRACATCGTGFFVDPILVAAVHRRPERREHLRSAA